MFDGKNDVCHFRAYCPQTGSKITLTPSRHQLHLKTDMSYPVIEEYSQEYFEPKIGRKIGISSLCKKQYCLERV